MATIREEDESSTGTSTQDDEVGVIQEQAQRGIAPLVDGIDAGALDDGFNKLLRGELACLRCVRIR
jgi:hypothetical protein